MKTKETWINDLRSKKIVFSIVSPFKGCLTKAERTCSRCGDVHVTTFNVLLYSGPLCRGCKYAVTTRAVFNSKPIGPYGSIAEAARTLGVKENMLRMRISMGWSVEEVLETTTRERKLQALPLYSPAEVYLISSTRTKKVYVGLTGNKSLRRFEQHLSDAKHGSNSPLHKAMRSLGYGSFKSQRLKRCSLREAPRWERFYIKKYKNTVGVFNKNRGGHLGGCNGAVLITYKGVTYASKKHFAQEHNLTYASVLGNFKKGYSPKQVLNLAKRKLL